MLFGVKYVLGTRNFHFCKNHFNTNITTTHTYSRDLFSRRSPVKNAYQSTSCFNNMWSKWNQPFKRFKPLH